VLSTHCKVDVKHEGEGNREEEGTIQSSPSNGHQRDVGISANFNWQHSAHRTTTTDVWKWVYIAELRPRQGTASQDSMRRQTEGSKEGRKKKHENIP
jgi:hypothetical protein